MVMTNIGLKYRLRDFYKINNAFQTLLEYPKEVLETFLQSILSLDEQDLTKERIDDAKMFILLRMNLCTIKDE